MKNTLAIILAAGRGTRAGTGLPKTYRKIAGEPILRHAVRAFLDHPKITDVQIVIHPDDEALYQQATQGLPLPPPIYGGETRACSVKNAMEAIESHDYVLIHDGARPFVSAKVIDSVIDALVTHDGAIPALPVTDALWATNGAQLVNPVPREELVSAQTPQGFHFAKYKAIIKDGNARDDAEAALQGKFDVIWVEGDKQNIKLTYPEDFA